MPKEIVQFNSFNGATPAVPDSGAIGFKNVRVDGSESIAIPENKDKPMNTSYVLEKNLFVEGKTIPISEDQKGRIFADNKLVGIVSPPRGDRLCMDVIGRQASIIDDDGHVKYLRYGYGNGNLIDIEKDEIIFEEDIVSSEFNTESIQFLVPISERYFLYTQYNRSNLFLYDTVSNTIEHTEELCSVLPTAWCYDLRNKNYPIFIYFAYYINKQLYITRLDLQNAIIGRDEVDINYFRTMGVATVNDFKNVNVDETYKSPGSRLDSIAVSHNYVFLGYNMGKNNPISQLDLEDDFLFSFDKDLFDRGETITVSCNDNNYKLNKSKLPFIPYQKIDCFRYYIDTGYELQYNTYHYNQFGCGKAITPITNYGYFKIPYEVTINSQDLMNTKPNTQLNTEAGFYDLYSKFSDIYDVETVDYPFPADFCTNTHTVLMYSPGYCGFAHVDQNEEDNVLLIGSLVIVNYDNNIVGYEIACPSKVWMNSLDESNIILEGVEDIQHDTYSHNGCSIIGVSLHYTDDGEQLPFEFHVITNIDVVSNDNLDKDTDHVFFDSDNIPRDIFYCWNGVEPTQTWHYKFFDFTFTNDARRRYFHLTKFFNNEEVPSDGSARFALFASELSIYSPSNHYNQRTHYSLSRDDNHDLLLTPINYDICYHPAAYVNYNEATSNDFSWVNMPADLMSNSMGELNAYKMFDSLREIMVSVYSDQIAIYDVTDDSEHGIEITMTELLTHHISNITFDRADGSAFDVGDTIRYKLSFVYDGICISPLTNNFWDYTVSDSATNIEITFNVNMESLYFFSRRLTGLRLYATKVIDNTEQELYRLVKELILDTETFRYDIETCLYTASIIDDGTRYASFNIDAGYSETMKNVSAKRKCQCVYNGMIFAGNVSFPLDPKVNVNTDNLVIRSLPYQPSVFNYQEEYCVLGFIPIALIPFNGRIYAFGNEEYAIINADTLAIEYTSKACGIAHRSHAVVTDYGIFVYYNNNLYAIDGNKIVSVGDAIKENNYAPTTGEAENFPSFKWLNRRIFVDYLQNRNAIVVIGETADATKLQDIIIFAYSLSTGKWATYTIDTPSNFDIVNLEGEYTTEDGSVVVTVSTDIETAEEPVEPPINPPNLRGQLSSSRLSTRPYSGDRYLTTYVSSQKLFSIDQVYYKDKNRTMELDYVIDFGTKNKKQIYDIQTYNGNTRVESEIYIDNKPASDYYNNMIAKSVFRISIKTNKPISMIKYVIRTFVVKEER